MSVIAVDWSGAASGGRNHIWLAAATHTGQLTQLENGRSREDLGAYLSARTDVVAIGLDFAFAPPAWFSEELGISSGPALWAHVVEHGESWLTDCLPPFWGRRGRPRPVSAGAIFRRTELSVPRTAGVAPKSFFQVGGAGSVGTGSIRGMPLLHRLHAAGARIWPFTDTGSPVVVEIYPRLLTGRVNKSNRLARERFLDERYPQLGAAHRRAAVGSDDAFDAAVSALVMLDYVQDLLSLATQADP